MFTTKKSTNLNCNLFKLNSNPYHCKLKFILTSKQKYNSKISEFETVRTLKIHKNDQIWTKKYLRINNYEKPTKKEERKKKKATFQNALLLFLSFVLFCLYYPQPFTLRIFFKWNVFIYCTIRGFITFEPPKIVSFLWFIFRQITKRKAIKIYKVY